MALSIPPDAKEPPVKKNELTKVDGDDKEKNAEEKMAVEYVENEAAAAMSGQMAADESLKGNDSTAPPHPELCLGTIDTIAAQETTLDLTPIPLECVISVSSIQDEENSAGCKAIVSTPTILESIRIQQDNTNKNQRIPIVSKSKKKKKKTLDTKMILPESAGIGSEAMASIPSNCSVKMAGDASQDQSKRGRRWKNTNVESNRNRETPQNAQGKRSSKQEKKKLEGTQEHTDSKKTLEVTSRNSVQTTPSKQSMPSENNTFQEESLGACSLAYAEQTSQSRNIRLPPGFSPSDVQQNHLTKDQLSQQMVPIPFIIDTLSPQLEQLLAQEDITDEQVCTLASTLLETGFLDQPPTLTMAALESIQRLVARTSIEQIEAASRAVRQRGKPRAGGDSGPGTSQRAAAVAVSRPASNNLPENRAVHPQLVLRYPEGAMQSAVHPQLVLRHPEGGMQPAVHPQLVLRHPEGAMQPAVHPQLVLRHPEGGMQPAVHPQLVLRHPEGGMQPAVYPQLVLRLPEDGVQPAVYPQLVLRRPEVGMRLAVNPNLAQSLAEYRDVTNMFKMPSHLWHGENQSWTLAEMKNSIEQIQAKMEASKDAKQSGGIKKTKRKRRTKIQDVDRNVIILQPEALPGFCGNEDVDALVRFIESSENKNGNKTTRQTQQPGNGTNKPNNKKKNDKSDNKSKKDRKLSSDDYPEKTEDIDKAPDAAAALPIESPSVSASNTGPIFEENQVSDDNDMVLVSSKKNRKHGSKQKSDQTKTNQDHGISSNSGNVDQKKAVSREGVPYGHNGGRNNNNRPTKKINDQNDKPKDPRQKPPYQRNQNQNPRSSDFESAKLPQTPVPTCNPDDTMDITNKKVWPPLKPNRNVSPIRSVNVDASKWKCNQDKPVSEVRSEQISAPSTSSPSTAYISTQTSVPVVPSMSTSKRNTRKPPVSAIPSLPTSVNRPPTSNIQSTSTTSHSPKIRSSEVTPHLPETPNPPTTSFPLNQTRSSVTTPKTPSSRKPRNLPAIHDLLAEPSPSPSILINPQLIVPVCASLTISNIVPPVGQSTIAALPANTVCDPTQSTPNQSMGAIRKPHAWGSFLARKLSATEEAAKKPPVKSNNSKSERRPLEITSPVQPPRKSSPPLTPPPPPKPQEPPVKPQRSPPSIRQLPPPPPQATPSAPSQTDTVEWHTLNYYHVELPRRNRRMNITEEAPVLVAAAPAPTDTQLLADNSWVDLDPAPPMKRHQRRKPQKVIALKGYRGPQPCCRHHRHARAMVTARQPVATGIARLPETNNTTLPPSQDATPLPAPSRQIIAPVSAPSQQPLTGTGGDSQIEEGARATRADHTADSEWDQEREEHARIVDFIQSAWDEVMDELSDCPVQVFHPL